MFNTQLKKGSVELLILAILNGGPRHGYEIGKLIESRSGGRIHFRISSFYPVLCRMEKKGWVKGRWVERAGERRRRFYRLTACGKDALAAEREVWAEFSVAINQVIGYNCA